MNNQNSPESPADNNRDERPRAEVTLLCEVRQGIRPWTRVRLKDISQTGFKIAWFPAVDLRQPLRIKIPGMQMLNANIRWKGDNALGCEFTAPLHIAVFEHLVRQSVAQFSFGR